VTQHVRTVVEQPGLVRGTANRALHVSCATSPSAITCAHRRETRLDQRDAETRGGRAQADDRRKPTTRSILEQ